jgi:hypothetical protein
MRERRWESESDLSFEDVLALGSRLAALGLSAATPTKEIIGYIEEWTVESPGEIRRLEPWHKEDVTLVQVHEGWRGDFFLLAGHYPEFFRRRRALGAYCSVSHPWRTRDSLLLHHPDGMFWVGFRDTQSFVRVRLRTLEVITPGETRGDGEREVWTDERRRLFMTAVRILDLPVETDLKDGKVAVRSLDSGAMLFSSWPDAFGPCQFEYNIPDAFELLLPASRLAGSFGGEPADVRAYLTGFSESALAEARSMGRGARIAYRCSLHCALEELPELLRLIGPGGRLYATLCEFQSGETGPVEEEAWVVVGAVGLGGRYRIEARLNRAPLPEEEMAGWLAGLLGHPMVYAPLSPFP